MSDDYITNVTEMRCSYEKEPNVYHCDFLTQEGTLGEKIVTVNDITEFEEIDNIWLVNFTQNDGLIFYFKKGVAYKDGSGERPSSCSVWRKYNEYTKIKEVVLGCGRPYERIREKVEL